MRFILLGAFGTVWFPYETRCKTGRTSAKVRAMKSCRKFSQRMHPIHPLDPKLTFWCVSYYLGHSGPFGCLTKLDAKWADLVQKFVPRSRIGMFRNERTRSTHWTINWCFDTLRTIWVHSGPFGCLTKLSAKRAELVQKFVPRSHVGIFHSECTRSTHWTLN